MRLLFSVMVQSSRAEYLTQVGQPRLTAKVKPSPEGEYYRGCVTVRYSVINGLMVDFDLVLLICQVSHIFYFHNSDCQ